MDLTAIPTYDCASYFPNIKTILQSNIHKKYHKSSKRSHENIYNILVEIDQEIILYGTTNTKTWNYNYRNMEHKLVKHRTSYYHLHIHTPIIDIERTFTYLISELEL